MRLEGQPGPWPAGFPALGARQVDEGVEVWSLSGEIEGRTTGSRQPCITKGCDGWLIGVRWETGQLMRICSEGWRYDPESKTVRVVDGGEISARWTAPPPQGTPPLPRAEWRSRESMRTWVGWRKDFEEGGS